MSMARTLANLKNNAPGIYWAAVDMAASGESSAAITAEVLRRVEARNEVLASAGRRPIVISFS